MSDDDQFSDFDYTLLEDISRKDSRFIQRAVSSDMLWDDESSEVDFLPSADASGREVQFIDE